MAIVDADQKWKLLHRKIPTLQAGRSDIHHSNMGTVMRLSLAREPASKCVYRWRGHWQGRARPYSGQLNASTKLVLITTVRIGTRARRFGRAILSRLFLNGGVRSLQSVRP